MSCVRREQREWDALVVAGRGELEVDVRRAVRVAAERVQEVTDRAIAGLHEMLSLIHDCE